MADGLTHLTANLVAGAGICTLALALDVPWVPVAAGAMLGCIITPDYDLEGTTISEQALRMIPIFGLLWMMSWYPYALKFRHRGWSHNWLVGTPTRILWSFLLIGFWYIWLVGFAWFFLGRTLPPLRGVQIFAPQELALLIIAWWLQDVVHYILDIPKKKSKANGVRRKTQVD